MVKETWAPVWGFTRYLISDMGRVKLRENGHIVKQERTPGGVMIVVLTTPSGYTFIKKVSRLVCDAFLGAEKEYSQVYYVDSDKTNCRLSNLRRMPPGDEIKRSRVRSPEQKEKETRRRKEIYRKKNEGQEVKRPAARPVKVIETGNIYPSQTQAAEALQVSQSVISSFLRGIRKSPVNGYTFEFADGLAKAKVIPPVRFIEDIETGIIYASQASAARHLNIHQTYISAYLAGFRTTPINGHTFRYCEQEKEVA